MLGLKEACPFLGSQRVKGSAFKQFTAKRPLSQKEPLRVSHVLALEQLVHTADSLYDRVAAG